MNYREKDYEEIFEAVLEDSVENGLISRADDFTALIKNRQDISNYYVMDKSAISKMFEIFYDNATLIYNSNNINLATGIDLDHIGDERGIHRPPATKASVEVVFTVDDELGTDLSIDDGIVISTNSGIKYETVEKLYISSEDTSATITCKSVEAGSHVKVAENTLIKIVDNLPYHLSVTNPNPSSGGTDAYTDEMYRILLLNYRKILIKGSLEAFEEYLANFEGIDSYKIVPLWDGTGTIKVILNPGTPELLNEAYNDLQKIVAQLDDDITMFAPNERKINIYALVNVDIDMINPYSSSEKDNIKKRIITAIKLFIDGGYRVNGSYYTGLNIGEDFIPHKLAVFLDEEIPELKNIEFNYPEDYITILDEEIGVSNEITIEMV